MRGQQRDKTVPLKGSLHVECPSPNKEVRALDLCLGSRLSEKCLGCKGGGFLRVSAVSWREHFVWSQLGFSPDRGLLAILPCACLQEDEDKAQGELTLRKEGAGPQSQPNHKSGMRGSNAGHIARPHAQVSPLWSPVGWGPQGGEWGWE